MIEKASIILSICGVILAGVVLLLQPSAPVVSADSPNIPLGDTSIEVVPTIPTPNDNISVDIFGLWSDSCTPMSPAISIIGNHIQIDTFNPGQICLQVLSNWQETVSVGPLPAGTYEITLIHHAGTPPISIGLGNIAFTVHQCGDDNGDGVVDIFDVIIELQIIAGLIDPTPVQQLIGDLNRDGETNIFDVIMKLQHIVGLVPSLDSCGPLTFTLEELSGSGQSGTATLTSKGSMTQVELSIPAGALETEMAHIHSGQCGVTLGGVVFPLTSFVGGSGSSSTLVGVTLSSLMDGDHAINLHEAGNPSVHTACGNIPKEAP